MRKLMFGAYGGVPITVGATPWAVDEGCRTGRVPCKYNIRDQVRAISRSAVDINPVKSRFVYLPQVRNWPSNFCNYYAVNTAVKAAIKRTAPGLNVESFDHLIMIIPKHCALGQGQQPGMLPTRRLRGRAAGRRARDARTAACCAPSSPRHRRSSARARDALVAAWHATSSPARLLLYLTPASAGHPLASSRPPLLPTRPQPYREHLPRIRRARQPVRRSLGRA
jgi:hypothetical protein